MSLPFYPTSKHLDRRCSEVALLGLVLVKECYKNHQISLAEGLGEMLSADLSSILTEAS